MSYAVVLHLDPAAEEVVNSVWSALSAASLGRSPAESGVRPHVTLASAEHIDQRALESATAVFAASLPSLRVTLSSIGLFNTEEGVLFFGVTVNQALLNAHAEYGRIFGHHARQPQAYFRAGTWVPHCTLATELQPARLGDALAVVRRTPLPLYATAHELALYHVPTGPVEILSVFQIGRPA